MSSTQFTSNGVGTGAQNYSTVETRGNGEIDLGLLVSTGSIIFNGTGDKYLTPQGAGATTRINSLTNNGACTITLRNSGYISALNINADTKLLADGYTISAYNTSVADSSMFTLGKNVILKTHNTLSLGNNSVLHLEAGSKIERSFNCINASTAVIEIDLGDDAASENNYAIVNSAIYGTDFVDATSSDGTSINRVTNVYGINGVTGETYTGVVSYGIKSSGGEYMQTGDILNSTTTHIYTVTADDNGRNVGITVSTNENGIDDKIIAQGGTQQDADTVKYLVNHQNEFNAEGQAWMNKAISRYQNNPAGLLRFAEETTGSHSSDVTAQSAIQSTTAAAGAVANQLTSFRSGNIAPGMASSFGSAGSTAAIGDMADADTLAVAYETGFTASTENEVYRKIQVWANGFGSFGEQGTDGRMTGYNFWNIGTMIGMDYSFSRELRVGGLLGYSYNKTDVYDSRGESTDNALRFGGYASYNWDNIFVDMSSTMGVHILETRRNLIMSETATGKRTGVDVNINGMVGYTFNLSSDYQITPSFGLSYTMFYDPDFTETGAGAGNVKYNSFTSNSLVQDIGVRFGKLYRVSEKLAFLPEAWGGWEVEYLNTGGTRNSTTAPSLGAQTTATTMNSMATHRAYWGAGMTMLINDNISVYSRYDHKIWDKGYNAGFSAGIKIAF